MKRMIAILGSGLVVLIVLGAGAVGTASAASHIKFWHCRRVGPGETAQYDTRAKCENEEPKPTLNGIEWIEVSPIGAIALRIIGRRVRGGLDFKSVKNRNVECSESGVSGTTGEIGNKSATENGEAAKVTVAYAGCKTALGIECNTKGKAKGEIVSNALKGHLGFISEATSVIGLLLEPETGPLDQEFECGTFETVKVRGSIICPISPFKTPTTAYQIKCNETEGKEEFVKFEGEVVEHSLEVEGKGFENFAFEKYGESGVTEVSPEEVVEGSEKFTPKEKIQ
jgi:hypothetical protein